MALLNGLVTALMIAGGVYKIMVKLENNKKIIMLHVNKRHRKTVKSLVIPYEPKAPIVKSENFGIGILVPDES